MRLLPTLTAASFLALTACNAGNSDYSQAPQAEVGYAQADEMVVTGARPAPMMSKTASAPSAGYGGNQDGAGPETNSADNPSSASYLAYRYNYSFALPVKAVAPTAKTHAEKCMAAGPSVCQVLSTNQSGGSDDYASAYLRLRAEPEWLKGFMSGVESSVTDAKGEMTNSSVSAEDLTRSILDTDARLKAQKTLRTRLEGLLETRDAKLPDLLALERELARVQGQIESATTTLNVLKKRVSMSVVDINYQSKQVAVSGSAFSPVIRAVKGFVGDFSHGLAAVIEFFARILPWLLLVILPGLWLLRRVWRRRNTA